MAIGITDSTYYGEIASAIRGKLRTSDTYKPSEMASAINDITSDDAAILMGNMSGPVNNASITLLPNYAVYSCKTITGLTLPSCSRVESYAARACTNLEYVSFPTCTYIGEYGFEECKKLSEVSFPSCSFVASSAFQECTSLARIDFPLCGSIGGSAFKSCPSLTNVELPVLSSIGVSAFHSCINLEKITLPNIRYFTSSVFYGCVKLSQVFLLGPNVAGIINYGNGGVFGNTPISKSTYLGYFGSIYVPASLYDSYMAVSTWSPYYDRFVSLTDEEIAAL